MQLHPDDPPSVRMLQTFKIKACLYTADLVSSNPCAVGDFVVSVAIPWIHPPEIINWGDRYFRLVVSETVEDTGLTVHSYVEVQGCLTVLPEWDLSPNYHKDGT